MNKKKVTVIFQPSGRRGQAERGKTILEAAQELGVAIESICGGNHTCGKCRVRVEEGLFEGGSFEPRMSNLSAFHPEESNFIGQKEQGEGYRLACVAELQGDALIYMPGESRTTQQVIRKEVRNNAVELNPGVKCHYVEVPPPSLKEPLGDFERLSRALKNNCGLKGLSIDFPALQSLPQRLRSGEGKVSIFVWMDREILDIQPGKVKDFYGLAVDIGTTTVAVYLCNLRSGQVVATDSMMNPQVIFGEDVMSRIAYTMTNREDGLKRLREAIVEGLNGLVQSVAKSAETNPGNILEMVVVGNTAMHHIFLGIDPGHLGLSPFPPAIHHSLDIKARDLGLKIHPAANVHVLPIEAGFVGADNVGVILSEEPCKKEEITLIIDVGTNGELILGNKQRLISASCASGPAFEGAHIKFGMRAAPGAIEHVRIDPNTLDVKYKIIGLEKWSDEYSPAEVQARGICGSGIIDAVAEMFSAGVLEQNGRIKN
ncbi:MAG: ASKHA domain-containing protein, partial [Thermodesulfobacteriota bacterium]|nr:ASKHA domain-containing protein [Thermodesulfobacteriota bacterium]